MRIPLIVTKMARSCTAFLAAFAALSAFVVTTSGQYHAGYATSQHEEPGSITENQVPSEFYHGSNFVELRRKHVPVLLHLAVAAASLAVVFAIVHCFRRLSGHTRARRFGFLGRRLASVGEDTCGEESQAADEEGQQPKGAEQQSEEQQQPRGADQQTEEHQQAQGAYHQAGEEQQPQGAEGGVPSQEDVEKALDAYEKALVEAGGSRDRLVTTMADMVFGMVSGGTAAQELPSWKRIIGAAFYGAQRLMDVATRGVALPPPGTPAPMRVGEMIVQALARPELVESLRDAAQKHSTATRAAERAAEVLALRAAATGRHADLVQAMRVATELLVLQRGERGTQRAGVPISRGTQAAAQALQTAGQRAGDSASGRHATDIGRAVAKGGATSEGFVSQVSTMMLEAAGVSGRPIPETSRRVLETGSKLSEEWKEEQTGASPEKDSDEEQGEGSGRKGYGRRPPSPSSGSGSSPSPGPSKV